MNQPLVISAGRDDRTLYLFGMDGTCRASTALPSGPRFVDAAGEKRKIRFSRLVCVPLEEKRVVSVQTNH